MPFLAQNSFFFFFQNSCMTSILVLPELSVDWWATSPHLLSAILSTSPSALHEDGGKVFGLGTFGKIATIDATSWAAERTK